MKAVIMAGGEGTRLRPLTCNMPKPMVPVANRPVMYHIIELLKKHGIKEIAVTLQYMPEKITEYFDDGSEMGVNIRYFIERTPLGTAGSVKNTEDFIDDTFIVISGDALTDIDLSSAIIFHKRKNAVATLVLKRMDIPLEYGVVITDEDGKVIRFLEKPSWGEVFSDTVNTGIYILSPEVLNFVEKGRMFDFSKDLFPMILDKNMPMYGYIASGYWCDIGDIHAYINSNMDVLYGKVKINIPGKQLKEGVWIGDNTQISNLDLIKGRAIIGDNCKIKNNCFIEDCIISDGTVVGEMASIKKSIVWKNGTVEEGAQLRGCAVCSKALVKPFAGVFEHAVIGEDCKIGSYSIIKPNVKIWPSKEIEDGIEVSESLVWGVKYGRSIFGNRGVIGVPNADITPEFATKLGCAYASLLKNNNCMILAGYSGNSGTEMILNSIICGIQASGSKAGICGISVLPALRRAINYTNSCGGIFVNSSNCDKDKICIEILDSKGANIDKQFERKLENAFFREDFRRCELNDVKKNEDMKFVNDIYLYDLISLFRRICPNGCNLKVLISPVNTYSSGILREVLSSNGCRVSVCNEYDFKSLLSKGGYDIGISVSDDAEKMLIADEKGNILPEEYVWIFLQTVALKQHNVKSLVIPFSSSSIMQKIADEHSVKVIYSKSSVSDMMSKMLSNENFHTKSREIIQFDLWFDAITASICIITYLSVNSITVSKALSSVPKTFIKTVEVECPWSAKGKVIREIMTQKNNEKFETLEGVKIYVKGGWVLILPDSEKPVCKVICEGNNTEFAEELAAIYADKIKEISSKNHEQP